MGSVVAMIQWLRRLFRRPDPWAEAKRLAEECGCGLWYDDKGVVHYGRGR